MRELIESVRPVVPKKGRNAGKQMFIINGKHFSNFEPKDSDIYVTLVEVEGEGEHKGKTFINVSGFTNDARMELDDKIKVISKYDGVYAQAIAYLLK